MDSYRYKKQRESDLHMARHDPSLTFDQRFEIWHKYNLSWWRIFWLSWITGQIRK